VRSGTHWELAPLGCNFTLPLTNDITRTSS